MNVNHVAGRNKGKIMLYALSYCPWCIKTKELLKALKVAFSFVDVDKLDGENKREAMEQVGKWNPDYTFPSLILDNDQSIIGFDEHKIRERLEN
jgi:glutaredoxin